MTNPQDSARDDARNQALAQVASICEMIAAYAVDYDRLDELRDDADSAPDEYVDVIKKGRDSFGSDLGLTHPDDGDFNYYFDIGRELAELESIAGMCANQDEALERIQEDALSVEYRSDWVSPGEEMTPSEFRILLCTGGPHVEIVGEIDHRGEPSRCWVNYRDWGTSGELTGADFDHDTVLRYCGFFVTGALSHD
jgi:hypothetical protein